MTWLWTVRQGEEIGIPHPFQPEPRKEGRGCSPPAQPTPPPRSPRSQQGSPHHCTTTATGSQVSISQDNKSTVQQEFSSGSLRHKSQSGVGRGDSSLSTSEGSVGPGSPSAQIPNLPQTSAAENSESHCICFVVATQGRYSCSQLPPLYAPSRLFFTMLWITASIFFSDSSSCK